MGSQEGSRGTVTERRTQVHLTLKVDVLAPACIFTQEYARFSDFFPPK